jgi:hypothetical protein
MLSLAQTNIRLSSPYGTPRLSSPYGTPMLSSPPPPKVELKIKVFLEGAYKAILLPKEKYYGRKTRRKISRSSRA